MPTVDPKLVMQSVNELKEDMTAAQSQSSQVTRSVAQSQPNAWLIRPDGLTDPFSVMLAVNPNLVSGVAEGDGVALLTEQDGRALIVAFGRIYRTRAKTDSVTIYFDALLPLAPAVEPVYLHPGIPLGTRTSAGRT